ncbi:MAG: molybdenum cofactor biosynthesis protein MoaE [Armatimonadota bacterium]|nr:molybdenum cofactor biosynthesis protein MoaE [Armatimonadota bacterium]MDR7533472.1 molybdenum cofactor biosynthesis protein MoaE [Armatimonadota bacterium]MDR7536285.1 molybdenum cofactor biosynthesis protein MoaE [Armatimonadota bacterium]
MHITVRLFAAYREAVGAAALVLEVPDGTTAGQVWTVLLRDHPRLDGLPAPAAVAVNDAVQPPEHRLRAGDQVALLAPVSGGAGPGAAGEPAAEGPAGGEEERPGAVVSVDLVADPIRVDPLLDAVRHPDAGAVVLFLGTVREHSRGRRVQRLEYEAYETLARAEMQRIAAEAARRFGARVAMVHRVGTLAIGEISVAIAAAAPHRREAFDAGRFAIDTLKQTVPIWKKEVWADGAQWIGQDDAQASRPPSAAPGARRPGRAC